MKKSTKKLFRIWDTGFWPQHLQTVMPAQAGIHVLLSSLRQARQSLARVGQKSTAHSASIADKRLTQERLFVKKLPAGITIEVNHNEKRRGLTRYLIQNG